MDHADGIFRQIADDAFDIAAHIAYLGELGGFHLDERRVHQSGQAAGDFGFADAGGTHHQDILRDDFIAEGLVHPAAAVAVAQGDGDGLLGLVLADDIAVEFMDNLSWGQLFTHFFFTSVPYRVSTVMLSLV